METTMPELCGIRIVLPLRRKRKKPLSTVTGVAVAIGEIDLTGFGIPIANTVSDRIFLASDNGLLVCLRDASPKYAVAKATMPPKPAPTPAKIDGEAAGEKPAADATPAVPVKPTATVPKPTLGEKKPDAPK